MRNRPNFVPKTFKYQPNEYRKIASDWTAIFNSGDGKQFQLGINFVWTDPDEGEGCTVYIQYDTHRQQLNIKPYKSIKQGLSALEQLLDRYSNNRNSA